MRVTAVCCTYKRPQQLAEAIGCFEAQDYPQRTLVVLDDAGQYANQSGDRWRIITVPQRFNTLGEKRNAAMALASPDTDVYCPWDDDDIYMPWHISTLVGALASAGVPWALPRFVYLDGTSLKKVENNKDLFHGAWAFTREIFAAVGGYPFMQSGQDQGLRLKFRQAGFQSVYADRPSFIYRWFTVHKHHFSALGDNGPNILGALPLVPSGPVQPVPFDLRWLDRVF